MSRAAAPQGTDHHHPAEADQSAGRAGSEPVRGSRWRVQVSRSGSREATGCGTRIPSGPQGRAARTAADGSFQTPDNLFVGSPYRVVVDGPGTEPILSNWTTIGEKPRVLLPMIQRPLGLAISGRVVDRQGKPVVASKSSNPAMVRSGRRPGRRTTVDSRWADFAGGRCSSSPRTARSIVSSGD